MIRRFLNNLLVNGVWFAAAMLNIMSATITVLSVLIIAVVTKWINLKL
jgi:hypothetical protein